MLPVLALALLSAGTVAELRLEPESEKARALVQASGVSLGEPVSPEAIRRAVELLFATGDYADVRVQLEPGPPVGLRFELPPTPRLAQIRSEPVGLFRTERLLQLTQLGLRDPLWPERQERAARDVALALVEQGYLEARVETRVRSLATAGALELSFLMHPGQRAHVGRVRLTDSQGQPWSALEPLLAPRAGEPFERRRAQACADRLRRVLVEQGRWRAQVRVQETYDPGRAQVDLAFELDTGPYLTVAFEGAPLPVGLRADLVRRVRDGGASSDALSDAVDRIESALLANGHRRAQVRHSERVVRVGVELCFQIEPGPVTRVGQVRWRGAEGVLPEPSLLLETRVGTALVDSVLERDRQALQQQLLEAGYAQAAVDVEVGELSASEPVTFRLRPGPRSTVGAVNVIDPDHAALPAEQGPGSPSAATQTVAPLGARLAAGLRLQPGAPYRARELALDRSALLRAYRNAGYLSVEVDPQASFSEDGTSVDVRFAVTPGERTLVGAVIVAGLAATDERVVRRELQISPGAPLSPDRLLESQRRLNALGLFERVELRELAPEAGTRRDVLVRAVEARRTTLAYGLGYAEREGARASLELTRRNLLGLDRTLTLFLRYGTRANRAFVSFREPYLLGRRRELFLTSFREEEERPGFRFIRAGALAQTVFPLSTRTSLIARYAYQRTRLYRVEVPLDEIDRQFQNSTLSGPSTSLLVDTRDDPIDPHRGRFFGLDLQASLPWLKGDRFVKGYIQGASYTPLGPRLLLAVSARLGLAASYGGAPESLPLPERFFAGGDFSLRGFPTDFVGPLAVTPAGELIPTGGNALLLVGGELRLRASRRFELAAFLDNGNVYRRSGEIDFSDLRTSAGLGLRYKSPIGPLRVDYGLKLDRRPLESAGRLHVTIGHAF